MSHVPKSVPKLKARDPTRGYGTLNVGTKIRVFANHFLVEVPTTGNIYHYDVDMQFEKKGADSLAEDSSKRGAGDASTSKGVDRGRGAGRPGKRSGGGEGDPPGGGGGAERKFPKSLKQHVMQLFLADKANEVFLNKSRPVYDGEKSLYSMKALQVPSGPDGAYTKVVKVPGDADAPERLVKVIIKGCNPLSASWADLHSFIQNPGADAAQSLEKTAVYTQCINTVFRAAALLTATNNAIKRSYFTRHIREPVDLGQGREMWTGFYSSVRPVCTPWKLTLNLDKAHTVFYKAQSVLQFMAVFFGADPKTLPPRQLNDYDRRAFEKEIKGLQVETRHAGRRKTRVSGIDNRSADKINFQDENGTQTTITKYFQNKYKITLKNTGLQCLKVGTKGNFLPMELCWLIEQKCEKRLNENQTAQMVRACTQTANERKYQLEKVRNDANILNYDNNEALKEFGIKVGKNMLTIDARQLNPPELYAGNKPIAVKRQDGTFETKSVPFVKPMSLKNWVVVNLAGDRYRQDVINLVNAIHDIGSQKGMSMAYPEDENPGRNSDLSRFFREIQEKFRKGGKTLDLIMVILGKDGSYAAVKRAGDVDVGVPTQVIKQFTMSKNTGPKLQQYVGNILLKINAKLGGVNVKVNHFEKGANLEKFMHLKRFTEKPTIVFGADVTHPAPGEAKDKPSVAAVVASYNRLFTQYNARVRAQSHRQEMMTDLAEMVKELLIEFRNVNGNVAPMRIIFFRDGVSEGQFEQVMLEELDALQKACATLDPTKEYTPNITYIIVGKRHHTRLICEDPRAAVGRGENVPAGTIVDTNITHFREMDYFLVSHGGIQGTSRPAHYNVLYDDADFSADEIEVFSYYLCYCYARCSRSVSIPAPAYYAHHVAFRARHHLDDQGSETASTPSGNGRTRGPDLRTLNERIKVHQNLRDSKMGRTMYFV